MNASELNRAQREGWVKLAFYILLFFYYIYGYVIAVVFFVSANFKHVLSCCFIYFAARYKNCLFPFSLSLCCICMHDSRDNVQL